jgi:flagellin
VVDCTDYYAILVSIARYAVIKKIMGVIMRIGELLNPFLGLNQLKSSMEDVKKAASKISSGSRVAKASDDPSGLVISERMKAQISGLAKKAQNVSMAIQRDKTTEGALASVCGNLEKINELTIQAQNGALTGGDRAIIQQEISQLSQGIKDIAANTQFNGKNLLPSNLPATLDLSSINVGNSALSSEIVSKAIETVSSMRSAIGSRIEANSAQISVLEEMAVNTIAAQSSLGDANTAQSVSRLSSAAMKGKVGVYAIKQKNSIVKSVMTEILGVDKYA